ncbi:EAL domain-containing protein [Aestuariibacter sp. AA17]|uniref:EAL domain-containing protein n=1 Tax=Fluctibacter corallii TaxID=2984329 RepID=A0ABT3ACC5_9ALTE|nr:EAL domain-containing protein [Aestuariibacter sp. AA17]MCV2886284.1 EAL domain-containing protein [Aestuariibacter sp. AA17]
MAIPALINRKIRNIKHVDVIRYVVVIVLFCMSWLTYATPLLNEPKFSVLSTASGLTQDSVTSLLVDQRGYLWVATHGGLNRFDGYQVKPVLGSDQVFKDITIDNVFMSKSGSIFVSSSVAGIHVLNPNTLESTRLGDWKLLSQPDFYDYASDFFAPQNSDRLLIALNERVIERRGNKNRVIYSLDDTDVFRGQAIRKIWANDNILLLATTSGLFGVNLKNGESKRIHHTRPVTENSNNQNVKLLRVDDGKTLWIGSVEGLYKSNLRGVENYILGKTDTVNVERVIETLNIWKMLPVDKQFYYVATDDGLYKLAPQTGKLIHLFRLTDSREYISDNNIVDMLLDKRGNLWLATRYDGAIYWVSRSTHFSNLTTNQNLASVSENKGQLSSGVVQSLYQSDKDTLWVGTRNGLNRVDVDTQKAAQFLVNQDKKALESNSTVYQVLPATANHLWLVTLNKLLLFDANTGAVVPPMFANKKAEELLSNNVWYAYKGHNDLLWVVTDFGVVTYSPETGEIHFVDGINEQLPVLDIYKIFDDIDKPDSFLIAAERALYRYHINDNTLTKVHSLTSDMLVKDLAPDSVVMCDKGLLWIAYPGHGLVAIDPSTGEEKVTLNRNNVLPTSVVYGLTKDRQGNIWMSSHQGILKLYPQNKHVQQFTVLDGIVTNEFNQGANLKLLDGRIVYGSQKGLTLFNPSQFQKSNQTAYHTWITEISIAGQPLEVSEHDDGTKYIELEHDQVGLEIRYSTLNYDSIQNTRYEYQLEGEERVLYPATKEPKVTFPTLKPGDYVFAVTAIDPITGKRSLPATLSIQVFHPPWASPVAYSFYVLLSLILLISWWSRRHIQERQIRDSHNEALKSRNRLTMALTASNSNIWEWDARKRLYYAPRMSDELGYGDLGNDISFDKHVSLIHASDRELYLQRWHYFIDNQAMGFDVTYRLKSQNGEWQWYRDVGSVVSDSHDPDHIVVSGTYTNVTESMANREKVRLFGEAFKHTRDWVMILNRHYKPVAANAAFNEAFGINEEAELEEQVAEVMQLGTKNQPNFWKKLYNLNTEEHWKGEENLQTKIGLGGHVLITLTSIDGNKSEGGADFYLLIMSDITEQKRAENKLRRLASYDSLTGLPNRTLLLDRVNHAIDQCKRQQKALGLFFIDLDRFKQVNDSLGHKAGDELLEIIAQRLKALLRQDDTVARLGGDEFVVVLENVKEPSKLSALASEMISVLEAPVTLGQQVVSVSSSIGIALFPGDAADAESLLRNADIAMYHAKEQGRSGYQYFTEHMNFQAQQRLELENKVKQGFKNDEFYNFYQPIIDAETGTVDGFELLMRWEHDGVFIPPDVFIPVAEELGLIEKMTFNAISRALPLIASWQACGRSIYLSVNLSARHFDRQMSLEEIADMLASHDLSVSNLRFEITEGALMRDYERAQAYMSSMTNYGFVIALDDFGTGYSSLKYLKEFPIDVLKIDKSFVEDIGYDTSDEAIIKATLSMADSLNMQCVAEGIEELKHIEFLTRYGCEKFQGYYFSRPVAAEDTMALTQESWQFD